MAEVVVVKDGGRAGYIRAILEPVLDAIQEARTEEGVGQLEGEASPKMERRAYVNLGRDAFRDENCRIVENEKDDDVINGPSVRAAVSSATSTKRIDRRSDRGLD